ncbi:MAG: tandem-95 repeat protein, partial [Proteobacteria bacterium]|nr:tandem-95 repeat protein [Pseudomonadota bacterium]
MLAPATTATTNEDTPITLALGRFADDDSDPLSWVVVDNPTRGFLSAITTAAAGQPNGSVVYTPAANIWGSDSFTYKICDNQVPSGCSELRTFNLTVIAVNDGPTNIQLSANTIGENLAPPQTVGTLSSTDADPVDSFVYTLSGTHQALFSIDGNVLRTSQSIDFETYPVLNIIITTTDSAGSSFPKAFTVQVINANETPTDISLSTLQINENTPLNTQFATITTSDPDAGNTFTYTLSGTDAAHFQIAGNKLINKTVFDFETKTSYNISIKTQDQGGLEFTKAFTIAVVNLNETPDDMALSANTISENSALNTNIGIFSATDQDASETHSFAISGADAAFFNLVPSGNTAQLRSSAVFNFENRNNYSITATVTDSGGNTFQKNFSITIVDVNENPSLIATPSYAYDVPYTFEDDSVDIPLLTATDIDAGNTLSYQVTQGTAGTVSVISGSPTTGGYARYTPSLHYAGADSFTFRVCDQGGLCTAYVPVTVTVRPVNDAPTIFPVGQPAITAATNEVTPLPINLAAGRDVDAGAVLTYVVSEAPQNGRLSGITSTNVANPGWVTGTQSTGVITYTPNYLFFGSDSFKYRICDEVNLCTTDQTVNVTVNSVDTAPVIAEIANMNINEDGSGTGAVIITDVDSNPTCAQMESNGLKASSNTTLIPLANIVIGGIAPNCTVTVTPAANGNGGPVTVTLGLVYSPSPVLRSFTVNVNAVNDTPVNSVPSSQLAFEDTDLTIAGFSVDDIEATTLSISLSAANGVITLNGITGLTFSNGDGIADRAMTFSGTLSNINTSLNNLVYRGNLHYNGSDVITIITSDQGSTGSGGTLIDADTVSVSVNPVNDAPVNTVPGSQSVNEDTSLTITGLSVTDPDGGNLTVTLSVTNGVLSLLGNAGLSFSA